MIKLQSNKNTFSTSRPDLTNLYKQQKDLKEINVSRVSGVKFLFKTAIW
jgi:Holliday junction resolvase RusA-like endonuclease